MFLRRLLTYIFIFFACLASYGQVNQVLWGKGKALYANPIATIDSLTYGQFLYGDTLYIIFDRESNRIVYDTIHVHMPGIVFHDTIYTTDTIFLESGRRIGLFSVGPNQYVTFSQGNLQYTQSTDTWQFANEQWECIGAGNIKEGALADKIDLFGWSTPATDFGVTAATEESDYYTSFIDWGSNTIGNDAPNTWRTLTYNEWGYLVFERPNASSLHGVARVNGVNGLILLPNDWSCPSDVTFKSGFHIDYSIEAYGQYQTIAQEQWLKMENAGAVFLPAAGYRTGSNVYSVQYSGYYWSAIVSTSLHAYCLDFNSDKTDMRSYVRDIGRSVRLVRDL